MREWLDLTKIAGWRGREDVQVNYHNFIANLFQNFEILDVGAGLCDSKPRLSASGNRVTTQDVGPDLPVDIKVGIEQIPSNSYDVVTAFDVIEHVEKDIEFVNHLLRISRKFVVISTPNAEPELSCPYHIREYTPHQFARFARGYKARYFLGDNYNIEEKDILNFFYGSYKRKGPLWQQDAYAELTKPRLMMIIIKEDRPVRENRFSMILPTVGREEIKDQLCNVLSQPGWLDGDELVIACDGFGEKVRSLCDPILKEFPKCEVRYVDFPGYDDYGHTPRNLLMPTLNGEYCIHLDDDDIMVRNILQRIREDIQSKSYVYLYRVFYCDGGYYLWGKKHTEYANVTTQCIVHRLDYSSYGMFEASQFMTVGGDWRFIDDTVTMNYDSVEFKENLISLFRPKCLFDRLAIKHIPLIF